MCYYAGPLFDDDTDEADLCAADILPAKYEGIDSLPAFVESRFI